MIWFLVALAARFLFLAVVTIAILILAAWRVGDDAPRFLSPPEAKDYHYHSALGPIWVRHHRSFSCEEADRWAQEALRALSFAIAKQAQGRLVVVPDIRLDLEEFVWTAEFGWVWGSFHQGAIPLIRVAIKDGVTIRRRLLLWGWFRERWAITNTIAHEIDHLLWSLLGREFDHSLPHGKRPQEVSAFEFAEAHVRHQLSASGQKARFT